MLYCNVECRDRDGRRLLELRMTSQSDARRMFSIPIAGLI